jgi:hypothetical protein
MLGYRTIIATQAQLPSGTAPAWRAMRHLGSPFAQMLAGAWELGNAEQRQRLEQAFPELVDEYARIAPDAQIGVPI